MPLKVSCRVDDGEKHEYDVNTLIFHKGKVYSGSDDGKIKAWSPDLKQIAEAQAHPCSVYCLAAADDTIYSCSNEGTIKSWEVETLKPKQEIFRDEKNEIWNIKYADGVLYAGDDQGNIRVFKNNKFYGIISVAEPVKDMALYKNTLFSAKDNDLVVTSLFMDKEKIQFGSKVTVNGRSPLILVNNKVVITSRSGRDIFVYETEDKGSLKLLSETKDAHELIINALAGCTWDSKEIVFSGGWDKTIKQWTIDGTKLTPVGSCSTEIVINSLVVGDKGQLYVGGGDGHILRVDL